VDRRDVNPNQEGRMTTLTTATVDTPLGPVLLVARGRRLCALDFAARRDRTVRDLRRRFGAVTLVPAANPAGAARALRDYFRGRLDALNGIAVDLHGTPFQRRVWAALRRIPAGRTLSYSQLAARIGRPAAVRAVGTANGCNPVSIVVPCHRVIASGGGLGGYGGGLDRKRWLLAHEGAHPTR
jgi:methylated-DNA-[protein]-cysteine S-methyltransferase